MVYWWVENESPWCSKKKTGFCGVIFGRKRDRVVYRSEENKTLRGVVVGRKQASIV